MSTFLVTGAGEAGLQAALTLRELGAPADRVVLAGPLSKAFLTGATTAEWLMLRDRGHLAETGSEHASRCRRREARPPRRRRPGAARRRWGARRRRRRARHRGRTADVAGARRRGGTGRRRAPVAGLDDAVALRRALGGPGGRGRVGAGFVGLEVAAMARARGATVTVLEAGPRVLGRVVSAPISEHVRAYESLGTTVHTDCRVTGLRVDGGRVRGVEAGDRVIPADLVLVGIGAEPRLGPVTVLDVAVGRGLVTDAGGAAAHPQLVAAGDCTFRPHPHRAGTRMCLESVNNAVEQGRSAAHALLGHEPEKRGVPWFRSDQGAPKLQIAGISDGYDRTLVRRVRRPPRRRCCARSATTSPSTTAPPTSAGCGRGPAGTRAGDAEQQGHLPPVRPPDAEALPAMAARRARAAMIAMPYCSPR